MLKSAAEQGAPAEVRNAIQAAQSPEEAINAAGQYAGDQLERQYKLMQIKKLQQDIASSASSGGITAPQGKEAYSQAFNALVIGLPKASQDIATKTFNGYLSAGNYTEARNYITRLAVQNLPAADQTQALGRAQATAALKDIQSLLDEAKAKGANTNLLTGSLINIEQKLGATGNPDLSYISSRIQQQRQIYRRSMTGVAFSPQENQEYTKIFPDLTNLDKLNSAKVSALTDAFDSNNRATLAFSIGDGNYNEIFGPTPTPTLPSDQSTQAPADPAFTDWLKKNNLLPTQ
jgi:hypothetical protein